MKQDNFYYTPVLDTLIIKYGEPFTPLVYGKIWRYTQGKDKVCSASFQTIADQLGISRSTVVRSVDKLVKDNLIYDISPNKTNKSGITRKYIIVQKTLDAILAENNEKKLVDTYATQTQVPTTDVSEIRGYVPQTQDLCPTEIPPVSDRDRTCVPQTHKDTNRTVKNTINKSLKKESENEDFEESFFEEDNQDETVEEESDEEIDYSNIDNSEELFASFSDYVKKKSKEVISKNTHLPSFRIIKHIAQRISVGETIDDDFFKRLIVKRCDDVYLG